MKIPSLFQVIGVCSIISGIIIFLFNWVQPFTLPITVFTILVGMVIFAFLKSDEKNKNYMQLATLIVVIITLSSSIYIATKVTEPLSPEITITNVGDVIANTSGKESYKSEWDVSLPIYIRVVARNPSDISIENFNFTRNTDIDYIFFQARETNVTPTIPDLQRVQVSDSVIKLNFPLKITARVQPSHNSYFGITRDKIGDCSFDITIRDLTTRKTSTISVKKEVMYVYDNS